MIQKILPLLFILCLSNPANSATDPKISNYVDTLLTKAFAILKDNNKPTSQKVNESEKLISENMDLEWMSKFVLGRYRRNITPEQLTNFTSLYSLYVVKSYSSGVKNYKDQQVKVKSQQELNKGEYVVKTLLLRQDLDPLHMDYLVRDTTGGKLKIFDVVTEGISLINSHQAEFANTIGNQGFDSLLLELNDKIKALDNGKNDATTRK